MDAYGSFYVALFVFLLVCGVGGGVGMAWLKTKQENISLLTRELVHPENALLLEPTEQEWEALQKGSYLVLGTTTYTRVRKWFFFLKRTSQVRGPYILPEIIRFMNMIVLGLTGSGKTTAMLTYIAQDIARKDNAVVIIDPKGDITERVIPMCKAKRRKYVVVPDDDGFNFYNGDGDAHDRADGAADHYAMCSDVGKDNKAVEYYVGFVGSYLTILIPLFESTYHMPITVNEVLSHLRSEETRERLLRDAGNSPEARRYREAIHDRWKEKDFKEALSGYEHFLNSLSQGKRGCLFNRRNAPAMREYIDKKMVIIIRGQGGTASLERMRGLIFISALHQWALHRDLHTSSHPVFIYIDEAQYFLSHSFPTFISNVRGFAAGVTLGLQNLEQLGSYVDTISGNARTKVANAGIFPEDATAIANEYGRDWWNNKTPTQGADGSNERVSQSQVYDYVVQPSEIAGIEGDEAYVATVKVERKGEEIFIKKERPVKVTKLPRVKVEPVRYVPKKVPNYPQPTVWEQPPDTSSHQFSQTKPAEIGVEGELVPTNGAESEQQAELAHIELPPVLEEPMLPTSVQVKSSPQPSSHNAIRPRRTKSRRIVSEEASENPPSNSDDSTPGSFWKSGQ